MGGSFMGGSGGGTGGSLPGLGSTAQPNAAMSAGLNPNAGLPAGTSGYVNADYSPAGATPGTGSQMTPQMMSVIKGIGSSVAQIGQNYAGRMQAGAAPMGALQAKGSAAPAGPAGPAPPPGPGEIPAVGDLLNRFGTQNVKSMTVGDLMRLGLMRQ